MKFNSTPFNGLFEVDVDRFIDERGWFTRIYDENLFGNLGMGTGWVQMNHSYTKTRGSIRGMHFQEAPFQEIKMVKCIRGQIWDVVIDLRADSSTRYKWFAIELSEYNQKMVIIPKGFAHGFQTLMDDCELLYFHSMIYQPGYERGIRYDDPAFGIEWKLPVTVVSDRDKSHPFLVID